jgi:hypothetical protein
MLINPPEPLALRLSSNLMVGLVKVYNQQCQLYFSKYASILAYANRKLAELQGFWQKIQGVEALHKLQNER